MKLEKLSLIVTIVFAPLGFLSTILGMVISSSATTTNNMNSLFIVLMVLKYVFFGIGLLSLLAYLSLNREKTNKEIFELSLEVGNLKNELTIHKGKIISLKNFKDKEISRITTHFNTQLNALELKVNGEYIHLGKFNTEEEAHQAYLAAIPNNETKYSTS